MAPWYAMQSPAAVAEPHCKIHYCNVSARNTLLGMIIGPQALERVRDIGPPFLRLQIEIFQSICQVPVSRLDLKITRTLKM
jgi:hypothetical protein